MHATSLGLILSATDLSAFLSCRHRSALDLAVAYGVLEAPDWRDPEAQVLAERGREHERRYLAWLRALGHEVVDLSLLSGDSAEVATREAMARGADVIYQAALAAPGWQGRADVLVRVERPSALGSWSYEPHDTKLARETRGGTILQLSAYADLLTSMQGVAPVHFHVVTPAPALAPASEDAGGRAGADDAEGRGNEDVVGRAGVDARADDTRGQLALGFDAEPAPTDAGPAHGIRVESYRVDEYAAYYRRVRAQLLATIAAGHDAGLAGTYPEPVDACELCRWWERCHARRRADDHLGFIAGIGRTHRREFVTQGVPTLAAAAALPVPLPFTPTRGSRETFERFREQARLQFLQRSANAPVHELLPVVDGQGLSRLPEPSAGDLFLDLEGAMFARDGGREYLFGVWSCNGDSPHSGWGQTSMPERAAGGYRAWWAHDDASERAAFEAVMDLVEHQWTAHPGMHVYHFAPYEPTAFKKLTGRYATRAELLDRLLRAERFVDLHAVVRQSLRAGVESYSIKQLEPFYDFARDVPLDAARRQLTSIELALESGAPDAIAPETRQAVEGYNRDDCRSTAALRDWLERLRADAIARGVAVLRPQAKPPEPPKNVGELEGAQQAARERLLHGLPTDAQQPTHPQHARWLMAYLLDWHRRADKAQYWERYRLNDLADDELFDERNAIAGLTFVETLGMSSGKRGPSRCVDRYRYPPQDTEIRDSGEALMSGQPTRIGDIVAHDRAARLIDIRKTAALSNVHPTAIFQATVVATDAQQKSLLRLVDADEDVSCGMDLLHRRPPRLRTGSLDAQLGETLVAHARRLAVSLDRTTLAVQGPPGSGKTYLGAQMIRALVAAGKRVGVVAPSHKVIVNLLDAVAAQAADAHETVKLGRKLGSGEESEPAELGRIIGFDENADARTAIETRSVDVLGGTAWLWAREEFAGAVDVLVVDEAGQFSLANALAVSPAADSLVLLGDPQQLAQPQKGSHPDGVDVSALQHVLGPSATMPRDRGLFLPKTWRLAPSVCAFTSELFYDGKLASLDALAQHRLVGTQGIEGAGLWWHPVPHDGNRHWSSEEIDAIATLVDQLLVPDARWIDDKGAARELAPTDILVVAPYNAHVTRLAERLARRGVRVGTVDKFQGQEAPVVIFAMAASTPADAPRGMDFLYSRHRLNVATSRAKCVAIVVASPALLEPECRTPGQMRLANALCRFVELATKLRPD